jgi:hypothetical protein
MFRARLLLAIVAVTALCGTADAGTFYSYVSTQDSQGSAGSVVTVKFYLQEKLTDGSKSFINGAGGGLFSAGFAVDFVSTTNGSDAKIRNGSFSPNPGFVGGPTSVFYNQDGNDLEASMAVPPPPIITSPPKTLTVDADGKIYLGSVKIDVGSGVTTYRLSSLFNSTILGGNGQLGGANGNTTTLNPRNLLGSDLDLDSINSGDYIGANATINEFTVGVPEPTTMVLGVVTLAGMVPVLRRRKTTTESGTQSPATV